MNKMLFIGLCLNILLSCNQFSSKNELFSKTKKLEYNRVSDPDKWNEIRKNSDYNSINYSFVNSIGKTRQIQLISILKDILLSSQDDSLTGECIFALGQMGSRRAEQILLDLPFKQLSVKNQRRVIAALRHCATEKSIHFYQQTLSNQELKSDILINAAICARKNLNISEIKYSIVDSVALAQPSLALSYFLYHVGNRNDLAELIQVAYNSKGLIRKYALRKLKKLLLENQNRFCTQLTNDSAFVELFSKTMTQSLKRSAPWDIQYYAIPLASILKDSLLTDRIASLTKSKNNQVSLTALEYLAEADKDLAISNLLERFGNEANMYIRGHIIKILAEYYPEKAYSFVMQNLDKGNSKFKSQLLDALAKIKSKMALRTLKQFINVDDPVLVCSAFDNLKTLRLLNNSDVATLLDSDQFCCVASALEYFLDKKQQIETDKLIHLYKKFDRPLEFEVQSMIIKIVKNNLSSSSLIAVDSLMEYASHDVLRRRIFENFPQSFTESRESLALSFKHVNHLMPDSIIYYSKNPMVEIETERGKIKIELYPGPAPYTVNNFVKLIDKNFYDGLTFHRIVPDFVSQGGDPLGSGWGGPDYLIPSEDNSLPYIEGSVGIATSGFDTGSSQFFICHSEQPHLIGNYTLFGQVIEGMDVVYSLLPEDKIISIILL